MDFYSRYEQGLKLLLERIGQHHPRYDEALVYEQQITENIALTRLHGENQARSTRRSEVIEQLNNLALAVLDTSFNELCRQAIALPTVPSPLDHRRHDWGEAPDVSTFFGREDELETLSQWAIHDRCRLVSILGIGGMGKTSLATKLAHQCQDEFAYIIWRSLRNVPPLADVLGDCIGLLSHQQHINLPDDNNQRITTLIEYMRNQRSLLILDNYESLLKGGGRAGVYIDGYEGYGQLLRRLGESSHESLVIVTSRDRPTDIARLEGASRPVRSFPLSGVNQREAREILKDQEIFGSDDEWNTFSDRYSGNPLALLLIAGFIRENFFGEIADFLNEREMIFEDLQDILDKQFARLSQLEQEIMYWLAIEREPVTRDALRETLLSPMSKQPLMEALQDLRRRSLIEQSAMVEKGFTLQNVVMEYMTERIVDHACDEIARGEIVLLNTHALMKAQSKEYVRNSQVRLILDEVLERITQRLGSREAVEQRLTEMLATLREE